MSKPELKAGDRVRVKADCADGYKQPWRGRFEKGLCGVVVTTSSDICWSGHILVQWDTSPQVKRPHEWKFQIYKRDIEVINEGGRK